MTIKYQFRELHARRFYLHERNERDGHDSFRDSELAALEWALETLAAQYPVENHDGEAAAREHHERRRARGQFR